MSLLDRLRTLVLIAFSVVFLVLLMVYNRTRYYRYPRRYPWVPDHIPIVDTVVTASEWVAFGLFIVVAVGLLVEKIHGLA